MLQALTLDFESEIVSLNQKVAIGSKQVPKFWGPFPSLEKEGY